MKIVHDWLLELLDTSGLEGSAIDTTPETLADVITHLGLSVEDIGRVGGAVAGVITAKVLRTERHPDAAKVHRVFVDAGDGVERHVWCGAFNMQPGDVLPLATPGTEMPDGRRIEPRPILGIESQGMLCSARELGLGDDHAGILVLPPETPLGVPYAAALGLTEHTVLDLDVLRNRPDAWSHLGVARDLAPAIGVPLAAPPAPLVADGPARSVPVTIVDGDRCGRFVTVVISGVRVGPSPEVIAGRLAAAGMRPINNVVDASNAVMLETGQPNHAYDLDTLRGGAIRVRRAGDTELIVTLDGAERTLDPDDLLICDGDDRPIGLAGVMGGANTEIGETTTTVVLELAWFEPRGIARAATRHGLRSEASARFDRGVDPFVSDRAAARFVELLRLTCPDLIVHAGVVDERTVGLPTPRTIELREARVAALLGQPFDAATITGLLTPIGFDVIGRADGTLDVTVPSWRPDCTIEVDLVEEVARHHGYDRIGRTVPKSTVPGGLSAIQHRRRRLREVLVGLGLDEAMPHPFLAAGDLARVGLDERAVRLVNPLVVGDDVLRTSLRPGLLAAIAFNESHRNVGAALFEIGHVYPPSDDVLPAEYEALGVVIAGADATRAVAVWREIAAAMGWGARLDQGTVPAGLHPTRSATLSLGRDVVGAIGEVHPDVLDTLGISERVAVVELHLDHLLGLTPKIVQWRPTSRFPSSDLDLAFVAPDAVTAERVDKAIRSAAGSLLVDLELFDVYRGAGLAADARSLAYRLRLQAADRTLTEADVAAVRDKAVAAAAKLGATLRG
jgi:phenylalanyl-tRNA synthetase beta chain